MRRKIALLAVTLMFLFFVSSRIFFFRDGPLESLASYILHPVYSVSSLITEKVTDIKKLFVSHKELREQCTFLNELCEELRTENTSLKASQHFYDESTELRSFIKRYSLENKIFSKILMRIITKSEHLYIINRGARDGVRKNMVALYKFQVIGRVTKVYPTYSKIVLITDQRSKVSVYANTSNAQGIIRGLNDPDKCELVYVNHLSNVLDNDLIISSGEGLVFPEGFCLGKITQHTLHEKSLYHEIFVKPLVDLKTIKFCFLTDQEKLNFF